MRGKIKGTPVIGWGLANHSPTLWRKGRALFRGCEVGGNLTAGMSILVPSKYIVELLTRIQLKALEGKSGRHELGFATTPRDYTRRKYRRQCGDFLKRAVGVPKLVC